MTTTNEVEEPDTQTYRVRLMVTARVEAEETFEAIDDEAAAKYVEAINPRDFNYTYDSDYGIEGDEIAFWGYEDDENPEVEVVLAKDGEPLSWEACAITKALAALGDRPDTVLDQVGAIAGLIDRARRACVRISGTMEG